MRQHGRTRGGVAFAVVAVTALLLAPCPADAQEEVEAPAATSPEAQAFLAGTQAIDEGRWADALEHFREAHRLTGSPVALFNVGFALRALGRAREARDAFDAVVAAADAPEDIRADALALRTEVARTIATVAFHGVDDPRADLRVDGRDVEQPPPWTLEVDPGAHTASVRLATYEIWDWSDELAPGSRTDVLVDLRPAPPAGGTNLVEEPWLWIVVGVVVLAGVGVAIWAVDDAQQLRPEAAVLRL